MSHWAEKYVGKPYIEDEYDCAELAREVLRVDFGQEIKLPTERACGLLGLSRQIERMKADVAILTIEPEEGDGVLMIARGRMDHIGIYCLINGVPYVLHNSRDAGHTCLHRVRDLPHHGLTVEGYYQWL